MTIGADGRDVFRCFVLPTRLTEDKFVIAFEVRPGNRRVVHHTLHFFDTSGTAPHRRRTNGASEEGDREGPWSRLSVRDGARLLPAGWRRRRCGRAGAAARTRHLPEVSAIFYPRGPTSSSRFTTTATAASRRTAPPSVSISRRNRPTALQGLVVPGRFLLSPPATTSYAFKGSLWLQHDCELHSVMPHMHLLGSDQVRHDATGRASRRHWWPSPTGTTTGRRRISSKAGRGQSRHAADVEAVYDNSSKNPNNPSSPPRTVFGRGHDQRDVFRLFRSDDSGWQAVRSASQSEWLRGAPPRRPAATEEQVTGEPAAGDRPVQFGGRGVASQGSFPTPLKKTASPKVRGVLPRRIRESQSPGAAGVRQGFPGPPRCPRPALASGVRWRSPVRGGPPRWESANWQTPPGSNTAARFSPGLRGGGGSASSAKKWQTPLAEPGPAEGGARAAALAGVRTRVSFLLAGVIPLPE